MDINRRDITVMATGALMASSAVAQQHKKAGAIKRNVLFPISTISMNVSRPGASGRARSSPASGLIWT
jgi:hypothetical protein